MSAPADQAASEVGAAVWRLAPFLGADRILDLQRDAEQRARSHAHQLADLDDDVAAEAALDLLSALWGTQPPPVDWWRTPLGRAVATVAGHGDERVTKTVAAAMLGVTPGRVTQLLAAGRLDGHPDGGVTAVSVAQRLRDRA